MRNKAVRKGTYCLLIDLKTDKSIQIGMKGEINFKKGYYVYVGSALNSLRGRIRRHLKKNKKLHWHVDYLLDNPKSQINEVYFSDNGIKHECDIAALIAGDGSGIRGFGCSDCKCNSHLIYFASAVEAKSSCIVAFKKMGLKFHKLEDLLQ